MLCGEKALKSNVPSWRCVTGIFKGASSEDRVVVKLFSAEVMRDSGAWNAGWRELIIEGVRTRTEGFDEWFVWWNGRVWRSGRKA